MLDPLARLSIDKYFSRSASSTMMTFLPQMA